MHYNWSHTESADHFKILTMLGLFIYEHVTYLYLGILSKDIWISLKSFFKLYKVPICLSLDLFQGSYSCWLLLHEACSYMRQCHFWFVHLFLLKPVWDVSLQLKESWLIQVEMSGLDDGVLKTHHLEGGDLYTLLSELDKGAILKN